MQFNCIHCKQRIEAPDECVGDDAVCPACGQAIKVPKTPSKANWYSGSPLMVAVSRLKVIVNSFFSNLLARNSKSPPPRPEQSPHQSPAVSSFKVGNVITSALVVLVLVVALCSRDGGSKKDGDSVSYAPERLAHFWDDLDNPEKLNEILEGAIDRLEIQTRGNKGARLSYAPNSQTPYTGWVKGMYDNGQVKVLHEVKNGRDNGRYAAWWENGQKKWEATKDYEIRWHRNGQKVTEAKLEDGNYHGIRTLWDEYGNLESRIRYENNNPVERIE